VTATNSRVIAARIGNAARRPGTQQCNLFDLRTSFGPIRIALPEDGSFSISAKTSFGSIRSELPLTAALTEPTSRDSLSGKIGAGECDVRLSNSSSSIQILRTVKK
jgi:hypothetical protein